MAIYDRAFIGIVRAADVSQIMLIEQGQLQRPALDQLVDGRCA
jgi:hypothetical protein